MVDAAPVRSPGTDRATAGRGVPAAHRRRHPASCGKDHGLVGISRPVHDRRAHQRRRAGAGRQPRGAGSASRRDSGVPAEYLVAITGVETFFGRITGRYRVLDALATLGFDYPPRGAFFRRELEQYLVMTREEGLDPRVPLGSYAGAMGIPQFMPSSFRGYAVDGNGDGHRDLWQDWPDVFASVANYFKEHGWRVGPAGAGRRHQSKTHPMIPAAAQRGAERNGGEPAQARLPVRDHAARLRAGHAGAGRTGAGHVLAHRLPEFLRHHPLQPQPAVCHGGA